MRLVTRFAPPLALMGLIFFLSAQPDLNSGLGSWDTIDRKLVHMAEYGLLWFLWWRALVSGHTGPAIAITLLYAATDRRSSTAVTAHRGKRRSTRSEWVWRCCSCGEGLTASRAR